LAHGDYESALAASEAALDIEPLYERAVGLLIQVERLRDNDASALQAFERYGAGLKEEMGLVPSEAIRRLVADIIRQPSRPAE
jgi:DNA-binding SARP family transcriptional activator